MFALLPRPDRLRPLLPLMKFYRRSGMQSLIHRSGLLRALPAEFSAAEMLMPEVPAEQQSLPAFIPAQGERRLRVGLLLGCVQQVFFSDVNLATARVLAAEGCEVVVPPDQGCCGALMVHAGEEEKACAFARRTIEAFEKAQVNFVAINAAGCGSSMKEYGHLLRDDPSYADRAKQFAARCRDISEILGELSSRAERHPLPLTVAYHDACHLQHAQNVRAQPRALLKQIPGLRLVEPSEAALCCGSAGIYNLVQPGPAKELGERKIRNLLATAPEIIAAGNPGCILQLQSALRQAGRNTTVVHTVQLLDASIRGVSPGVFLNEQR